MSSLTEILEQHRSLSANFGSEPLLVHPNGRILDLSTGYIPLLSTFTTEDKAAKGLRKSKETSSEPVYFSLLELVGDNRAVLLSGPTGSGKSTFARHLCSSLAIQDQTVFNALSRRAVVVQEGRHEDVRRLHPCYFAIHAPQDLEELACHTIPALLATLSDSPAADLVVVVDTIENSHMKAAEHIESIVTQLLSSPTKHHRLLLLCDSGRCNTISIPSRIAKYNIKPLSVTQRRKKISQLTQVEQSTIDFAVGDASSNPGLFALALQSRHEGHQPEVLLDSWLATVSNSDVPIDHTGEYAFYQTCQDVHFNAAPEAKPRRGTYSLPLLSSSRRVRDLLTARHLVSLPADTAAKLFQQNPGQTTDIIQSLLTRLFEATSPKFNDLTQALLQKDGTTAQQAALLLAKIGDVSAQLQNQIRRLALLVLEEGQLSIAERQDAAVVLSRLGDPRDLIALVDIPAGMHTFGSNTHPNSQPIHQICLDAFRIGMFPVTVEQFKEFSTDTERYWVNPERDNPTKQNLPATDVTWHDAVAYCEWLTTRWRADGSIGEDERVRLPSEPEWEKASSGEPDSLDSEHYLYPWGTEWHSIASNSEDLGLNQPCAVGLFPNGKSFYGCHDMAGNIWEWCSTLWGEDMASPSYRYPWQDDGREAADAESSIRRVLRGGCFSSGKMKANCTYRRSLEPNGYWRGNGFRIVVGESRLV